MYGFITGETVKPLFVAKTAKQMFEKQHQETYC
jgi:hypothetical protein